jgi:hypothetical protein
MESREQTESHPEDREQGTPQGQLTNEEPQTQESGGGEGAQEEGGADSAADAAGEGG